MSRFVLSDAEQRALAAAKRKVVLAEMQHTANQVESLCEHMIRSVGDGFHVELSAAEQQLKRLTLMQAQLHQIYQDLCQERDLCNSAVAHMK